MPRNEGEIGIDMPFEVGDTLVANENVHDFDAYRDDMDDLLPTPREGTKIIVKQVQSEHYRGQKGFLTYSEDLIYFDVTIRGEKVFTCLQAWCFDFFSRPDFINRPEDYDCDLFQWVQQQALA